MRASFSLTQHWLAGSGLLLLDSQSILAFLPTHFSTLLSTTAMSRAALFIHICTHSFTMVHFYTLWLSKWGVFCASICQCHDYFLSLALDPTALMLSH